MGSSDWCTVQKRPSWQYLAIHAAPSYQPEDDINVHEEVEVTTSATIPLSLTEMIQDGLQPVS